MVNKTLCEICGESFGNIYAHRDTQKHRMNAGITREEKDGKVITYLNGKIHSYDDEPAKISGDADSYFKFWYQHGKIHRDGDLPAITTGLGVQEWLQNGKLHRVGNPARITGTGGEEWYHKGKLHRVDGPAITKSNGTRYWYRNGKIHRDDGPAVVEVDGTKWWYQQGKIHREDAPAVVIPDLGEAWYRGGILHRDEGYAIDFNVLKVRYLNGTLGEGNNMVVWPDGTTENNPLPHLRNKFAYDRLYLQHKWVNIKNELGSGLNYTGNEILCKKIIEYLRTFL